MDVIAQINNNTAIDANVKYTLFNDNYDLIQEIGKGSFSKVYLCQLKSTKQQYAVKVCMMIPLYAVFVIYVCSYFNRPSLCIVHYPFYFCRKICILCNPYSYQLTDSYYTTCSA